MQRQVDKGLKFSLVKRRIWCERGYPYPTVDFCDAIDMPLAPEELAYVPRSP